MFSEVVVVAPTADELAAVASRVRARIRSTVGEIVLIGEDLQRVKERLLHGEFLTWVTESCGISPKTAENAMNVARLAARLGDRFVTVTNLSPGIVYELAARNAPDGLVDRVVSGEVPATIDAIRAAKSGKHSVVSLDATARRFVREALPKLIREPETLAAAIWDLHEPGDDLQVANSLRSLGDVVVNLIQRWTAEEEAE